MRQVAGIAMVASAGLLLAAVQPARSAVPAATLLKQSQATR
ncbi:MAG: hypothetical protein ABIP38_15585 [Steroidobacteraceae bacterium]